MTPQEVATHRKRLGLTQAQFADRLGVHERTVSKWETTRPWGRAIPEPVARLILTMGAAAAVTRRKAGSKRKR